MKNVNVALIKVRQAIKKKAAKEKLTIEQLAWEYDIPKSTLYDFLSENNNPTIATLSLVTGKLGLKLSISVR